MATTAVTASPGFISIAVSDPQRSAAFYEQYLGAVRDTFDFGPDAVAFVGWPTFSVTSVRRPGQPGPSPQTTSIQLWWRASDAQAHYEKWSRPASVFSSSHSTALSARPSRWPIRMAIGSPSMRRTNLCSGRQRVQARSRR
jgi:hypothetical protein